MKKNTSIKGRGTASRIHNRFESVKREAIDDGWGDRAETESAPSTEWIADQSRSIISYNDSPDIPFDRSINPYRGCEHGCIYCYARPTHAWLGYSPGIDFETKIIYKPDADRLLRHAFSQSAYQCRPMGLGTNTDPWQPAERKLKITRSVLEVLREFNHPVMIVTKSSEIERDIDILSEMAQRRQVLVHLSITSLDAGLSRALEPRTAAPLRRLKSIARLANSGVPVGVIMAPVIPFLNDKDIEAILEAAYDAGARYAHTIFIRLPREVSPLFQEWLEHHYPLKAAHVMNRIRDSRGGRDYESDFGSRQRGQGVYANMIARRFEQAHKRLGYVAEPELDCTGFAVPGKAVQMELF